MTTQPTPEAAAAGDEAAPSRWKRLAPLARPRTLLILAAGFAFGALIAATRWAPEPLLSRIVTLDAKRLAITYLAELDDAFELPGEPLPPGRAAQLEMDFLLGPAPGSEAELDLFDTTRFTSAASANAVLGYVVFNRFGDRMLSAGKPLFRSLASPTAARRFEAARTADAPRTHSTAARGGGGARTVSVVVPLRDGQDFAGAVMLDVVRNGVEPGVLSGIERSIFALVALVLTIAFVLLVLLTILRISSNRARDRAAYLAQFDALTGLHNRETFQHRLAQRIAVGHDRKRNFAFILIDIRRFGWINDTFSETVGDAALRGFAERLDTKLRRDPEFAQCGATAARLGADEFAAFFACDTRAHLARVCGALARICDEAMEVSGVKLRLDAAFGAALFPFDGANGNDLQASARYALDVAKTRVADPLKPTSVCIFDSDIAAAHRRRRRLLNDIEGALGRGEMELHYQPQMHIEGERARLVGFEALLRWQHPHEGAVSPAEFIPLAEQSGVIRELGAWCLHEAAREAASWPGGDDGPVVAVNVSPAQFGVDSGESGLAATVSRALGEAGLAPRRLELEITEGLILKDSGNVSEILDGLIALGVAIALDDFGTGYSSLSYLSRIPVSKVKLDRSFVLRLAEDEKVRAIVGAVAAMCGELDMGLLAEGVETEAEQALLVSLGCRHIQGYLHGRPVRDPRPLLPGSGEATAPLAA